MKHYLNLIVVILLSLISFLCSDPLPTTSMTPYTPTYGTVVGYSSNTKELTIVGGVRWVPPDLYYSSPYIVYINVATSFILFDDNNTPNGQNASTAFSHWRLHNPDTINVPSISLNTLSMDTQSATQIGNLIYIVNPIGEQAISSRVPSKKMLIYNIGETFEDPMNYPADIPGVDGYSVNDRGCVVSDGIDVFLIGNHQVPGTTTTIFASDLYKYDTANKIWITLTAPTLTRYRSGCAISGDNQYIYLFGGLSKGINPDSAHTNDFSVRETEKYEINGQLGAQWTVIGASGDLHEARWDLHSYTDLIQNKIYLYGGDRRNSTDTGAKTPKIITVYDIASETMESTNLEWNSAHQRGISNTIRIDDICDYPIAVSFGGSMFNTQSEFTDKIQFLRFIPDTMTYPATYQDGNIYIEIQDDMENIIYDAYRSHTFTFNIIVTTGASFIPTIDENEYEFYITNWQNTEMNTDALDAEYARRSNGRRSIVTFSGITEMDAQIFNACNGVSNVIQVIQMNILIRRRTSARKSRLCAQTNDNRLDIWFFRDDDDGAYSSSIRLEVTNAADNAETVSTLPLTLHHNCEIRAN